MYKFFAFLGRMKYIKRWSLMRTSVGENVMEHSQQVAVIAHALGLIKNKIYGGKVDLYKIIVYAQYHEASEVVTGDLPTPIKYFNEDIKIAYKGLESVACRKLISMLPDELKEDYNSFIVQDENSYEYAIVKAADRISAYVECLEEIKCGNNEFAKAKETIEKDIKSRNMEEVNYFMENCVKAFSLTLDELD